jgi:hypothetical protein
MKNTENLIFEDAWLGLGNLDDIIISTNNMIGRTKEDIENPDLHLLRLLRDPRYFGTTAKLLFDIELHPIQIAILQEFWIRPFPMFVASRGFGKMLRPEEQLRTPNGWTTMENIKVGDKIYGGDGKLTTVINKTDLQNNLDMYKITLRDGRTIECCGDHQWKVYSQKNKKWNVLKTKEMLDFKRDRIGAKSNGKEYLYALPINKPLIDEEPQDLPLHPYVVGVLLGDGCLTQNRITFSSTDQHIVNKINSLLPTGYYVSTQADGITHGINTTTNIPFYKIIEKIGIHKLNSHNKYIPLNYLYGSYNQKIALLQGLMDTDGYSNGESVIEYYTVSSDLNRDILDLARSLGIHCKSTKKPSMFRGKKYADCHRISMYTNEAVFSLPRKLQYLKHTISKQGQSKYDKVFITNIEYIGKGSGYCIMVDNDDSTYLTKDYIVTHNSFLMALYCTLRCILVPGTKIVVVGAAFRQSKIVFEYMETLWRNSPILRSIFNGNDDGPRRDVDRCTMRLGESWTIAVPMGDGSKIRGLRAHIIIADEFASISPDIYETVVSGFAAVSANPIQNVKEEAKKAAMLEVGLWNDELEAVQIKKGNQAIIAGTADYSFKHFASYWKRYKAIINSRGDKHTLEEIFKGEVPDSFNWKDYSIIRVPYELIPKGFMDDKQVSRAKATIHTGIYNMEYAACFTEDSDGFFRRSLIESCVTNESNPIVINGNNILFDVSTKGNPDLQYIYGIDPASEKDNFTIVVLELHKDHSRIVYGWSTNRNNFKDRQKTGLVNEYDFYSFCARKIRNLMKIFPCSRIGLDAQGGGVAIEEALHDPGKLEEGENLIWPVIDIDKPKDTDDQSGLHILELVQFARADWTAQANHGLRKDLEDKILLFPRFDQVTLALALDRENRDIMTADLNNLYDSESECVLEIEELKNELTTIVMTQTSTGPNARDRWDTPEIKLPNGKKGKLRKDRYSALLIANMLARQISRTLQPINFDVIGNNLAEVKKTDGQMYKGPNWFTENANANIYGGIYR